MKLSYTSLAASLLTLLALLGTAQHGRAQSVQPVIMEYTVKGASSGSYVISNDMLVPIFVSIQAQSFTIDPSGKALYQPLSKNIHLDLSTTSLKLPPKQSRTIYYRASADQLPAWFTIYSTLMGVPGQKGITMQLRLPHTVYLLPKEKASRTELMIRNPQHVAGAVQGDVVNAGNEFIRAKDVEVLTANGKKLSFAGFPLLPHSYRTLALPTGEAVPARVTVRFNDFSIEQSITQAPGSTAGMP